MSTRARGDNGKTTRDTTAPNGAVPLHCAAEHEKAEPGSVLRDAAGQACSSTCGDTVAKGRDLLDGLREQLKAVAAEHALYG